MTTPPAANAFSSQLAVMPSGPVTSTGSPQSSRIEFVSILAPETLFVGGIPAASEPAVFRLENLNAAKPDVAAIAADHIPHRGHEAIISVNDPVGKMGLERYRAFHPLDLFVMAEPRHGARVMSHDRVGTDLADEFNLAVVVNPFPVDFDQLPG
nr:hypothetical protein [Novosphingobium sp. G106]